MSVDTQMCANVISVQPDWCRRLPLQQQSVLFLAARGPDGVAKRHPCKAVVRAYRATVIKAAYYGRELRWGEEADGFMALDRFADEYQWGEDLDAFFASEDSLPHHYLMHRLASLLAEVRHSRALAKELEPYVKAVRQQRRGGESYMHALEDAVTRLADAYIAATTARAEPKKPKTVAELEELEERICPSCGGSGVIGAAEEDVECFDCRGGGIVLVPTTTARAGDGEEGSE